MTDLRDLALALVIGLLIGVERGWRSRHEPMGARVAGVRTFGLLGLLGGVVGLLGRFVHPLLAIMVMAATGIALVMGYQRDMARDDHVSVTATIAALLTLCLGLLSTSGYPALAIACGATVTLLLSLRTELHGLIARLTEAEMKAIARFALIALAVLPFLPDRYYGPYDAWNPRTIWFVVVLVSGFSFAGYAASRLLGSTRGTLATAAIGGMYSSTAVTAALSRRLKDGSEPPATLAAGIAIASAVMFLRVLVLTGIFAPFALPSLALVIGPATVVAILLGVWSLRRVKAAAESHELTLGNPFELLPALGFALLVALMALAARIALDRFGDTGLATVLAITGTMDVDAAIVTMGGLPSATLDARTAGLILAVPVMLNTLFKAGVVISLAGWKRGLPAALPLAASILAGALTLLLLWLGGGSPS